MTTASLNKRYAAKLSTNFVGLAINLVTYAVIPRGLGPKAYGDFSFLTNFFTNLMPLLSLSTSLGFYTKLSQRQHEFAIVSFYFQFTGLAFTTLMIFVAGSKMVGLADIFWVDQRMIYVYMAALWVMLTWSSQLLTQVADAYGLTVTMETARIGQKCIGLVIILALYFLGHLDLTNFFLYHYGILIILIILLIQISGRKTHLFFENWRLKKKQVLGYIVEFYRYSHPLFVFSLIGLIAAILDRWLLQQFGGSIQQGFFSLSYQIGAVCFLFTSAMTSLLMREFSISYGNNDIKEMAKLFRRYVPLLYSIASYFGCFICVQAAKITYIFGGSKFIEASIPVAIMALYPIHQTYGQLSSSVFFATGQTKVYRNINLFLVPISLVVTYFMLAPVDKMGLNAGATGLAIKFVILQFVGVNIQLFYNARFLRIRYIKYVSHQILCFFWFFSTAYSAKYLIDGISAFHGKVIFNFFLSGLLYSGIIIVLGYFLPAVYGLKKNDVRKIFESVLNIFKGIIKNLI